MECLQERACGFFGRVSNRDMVWYVQREKPEMTETDEPTIRDVLAAIDTLKNEMSETEERLRGEIQAGREHLKAMETRLNAKIESVKAGLKADIAAVPGGTEE